MEMTKEQRNLMIAVGACAGCWLVHYIATAVMAFLFYVPPRPAPHKQAAPKPVAAKATAVAKAPPATGTQATKAVPKPGGYSGVWTGTSAVEGRGLCNLRLELHDKGENQFSGFSTLGCTSYGVLLLPKQQLNSAKAFMNKVNPSAAIISGVMENDAIHFKMDKTIGTDSAGCALTNLTLTPFGFNQLAAEWKEGDGCPSGNPLLHKVGK